jgi:hypothetical protein
MKRSTLATSIAIESPIQSHHGVVAVVGGIRRLYWRFNGLFYWRFYWRSNGNSVAANQDGLHEKYL